MALPDWRSPSPFLLERGYWQDRLARMDAVHRGLLILPRPDLANSMADVVEWRVRGHDGAKLWGLRAQSPFHPEPRGVCVREVCATELPEIRREIVAEGWAEFVLQVPAGRRLEDRVLDLLRVIQVALSMCGVTPESVRLEASESAAGGRQPADELVIAERLLRQGICSLA
jgi:hypothetical protein